MNDTRIAPRTAVRRTRAMATAVVAAGLTAAALGSAAPASAAKPLPDNLKKYADCPVSDKKVSTCIYVESTAATFKLGKWVLTADEPLVLQFGLKFDNKFKATTVGPTNGSPLFSSPALVVPGGIIGIPGTGVGPLAASGTPELTSIPEVNIPNLLQRKGVAFKMDLRAKVKNDATDVFSGNPGCFIGSAADPISLNLTTGTTTPPPPNEPVSGSRGTTKVDGEPEGGLRFEDVVLRENSFKAPGSSTCGPFGTFNGIVNEIGKIPSAAGTNDVTFKANIYQVDANTVRKALKK